MKRALALCTVLAVLGFSAFGIGTFSGSWSFGLSLTGSTISISKNVLTIKYNDLGMTFTGKLDLPNDTFSFGVSGNLGGLFDLSGTMYFDITDAAYKSANFTTSLTFAGLTFALTIDHWNAAYLPTNWPDYCDQTPSVGMMLFTLDVEVAPFAIELIFADCCTGIEFNSILVTLEGLDLCCGIQYDVEWKFTKAGFDHITFTADKLFDLCCGIYFGLKVEFGADYKQVTPLITFDWGAPDCITLGVTLGKTGTTIDKLTIDYLGITCQLSDCSKILFGTSFTATVIEDYEIEIDDTVIIVDILKPNAPSAWGLGYGSFVVVETEEEIYAYWYEEYETIQLSLCGAGCCGGQWTGSLKAYFGNLYLYDWEEDEWVKVPTLFGLSRFAGSVSVPFGPIALDLGMSYNLFTGVNTITIGWTFTF